MGGKLVKLGFKSQKRKSQKITKGTNLMGLSGLLSFTDYRFYPVLEKIINRLEEYIKVGDHSHENWLKWAWKLNKPSYG